VGTRFRVRSVQPQGLKPRRTANLESGLLRLGHGVCHDRPSVYTHGLLFQDDAPLFFTNDIVLFAPRVADAPCLALKDILGYICHGAPRADGKPLTSYTYSTPFHACATLRYMVDAGENLPLEAHRPAKYRWIIVLVSTLTNLAPYHCNWMGIYVCQK
jgi:hypothetical protein